MGKKGKKKGKSVGEDTTGGTLSQPQRQQQQQQQPERQEPRGQQQQPAAVVAQATSSMARLSMESGPGAAGDSRQQSLDSQDSLRGQSGKSKGRGVSMGRGNPPGRQAPAPGTQQAPQGGASWGARPGGQPVAVAQQAPQGGAAWGACPVSQPVAGTQQATQAAWGARSAGQPVPVGQQAPPGGAAWAARPAEQPIPGTQPTRPAQMPPPAAAAAPAQVPEVVPPHPGGQTRGTGEPSGKEKKGGQAGQQGRGSDSQWQQQGGPGQAGARRPGSQVQQQPSRPSSACSSASTNTVGVSSGKTTPKTPGTAPLTPVKTSLTAAQQSMYRSKIPKRKNVNKGGTAGRPITVETNMIPIIFGANFASTIIHYNVILDPDRPKFMFRHVIEAVRVQHYPKRYPAFDGRCNLFSAGALPFGNSLHTDIEVYNPERQTTMSFKVSLVKVQEIDMSWLKRVKPGLEENDRELIAIQALDVVLRSAPLRQKAITVGKSFFSAPENGRAVDLGNGIDLWIGTFQSAVLGWKPYFNVDVAHKGFPRNQPVLNLMKELCGDPRSPDISRQDIDRGRRRLEEYLKGLKVTYEIPGQPGSKRTMGINNLGKSSKEATFELQDGSVTTVQNYFAKEKRYKIRYPDIPTLWVGSKNKCVLIPAELCTIESGQATNKKMDERQTATMIKYAATNTATRKQKIMDGFMKRRFNEDPGMKEFGVSVGGEFEKVKARVLDPPSLYDKREISVRKGVWRANTFHTPMVLPEKSWTILNLNDRTQETPLRNLVEQLKIGGSKVGMSIGNPLTPFRNMRAPMRDLRDIIQFFNEKKHEQLKLIIVIVPDKVGPVYGKVKQVAELNVGILTQCIKATTVERKMNDATAGNILLKINSKLNGTNQIFTVGKNPPCLNKPCMIVGADVTHPSPDSIGIPSIAAVAASHSPTAFKYNVKIRLQPPKTEIILHLEEIMREQLLFFYKSTGHKPQRIVFYRDGVSEGQFPQVMHHELQAIRNACSKLSPGNKYEPLITFLVVQKRHHIRLFPTDLRNSDDRNGNVQAGTVVDTDITHPSHIDFYLVSHASIQGTARPTKYRCLWDDSDMSEDEIEQMTYYLCHMFSRCTRSVSYPAPTYYAHLAAFRARALTNEVEIRLNNLEEEQRMKMTIKPEIQMGNPMFFV